MSKLCYLLVLPLLTLVVSGCETSLPWSSIEGRIWNDPDATTNVGCLGGFRAAIEVDSIKILDETAPNGEVLQFSAPRQPGDTSMIKLGNPVKVEAWCYDLNKSEVGYIKVEGKLKYDRNSNTINITSLATAQDCLPSTEQRGQVICISSSIIE